MCLAMSFPYIIVLSIVLMILSVTLPFLSVTLAILSKTKEALLIVFNDQRELPTLYKFGGIFTSFQV